MLDSWIGVFRKNVDVCTNRNGAYTGIMSTKPGTEVIIYILTPNSHTYFTPITNRLGIGTGCGCLMWILGVDVCVGVGVGVGVGSGCECGCRCRCRS